MYGPMKITSGFRHRNHPIEAKKARPGTHALGLAVDVRTGSSAATFALVDAVFRLLAQDHILQDQFGVGIAGNRFVHIDQGGPAARGPRALDVFGQVIAPPPKKRPSCARSPALDGLLIMFTFSKGFLTRSKCTHT